MRQTPDLPRFSSALYTLLRVLVECTIRRGPSCPAWHKSAPASSGTLRVLPRFAPEATHLACRAFQTHWGPVPKLLARLRLLVYSPCAQSIRLRGCCKRMPI